jgi:DNA-binding NtrC family response regulator
MKTARPNLRIVLMTGYSDLFAETSDPHQLGADAIIQKPFSRDEIKQVLARVLSGSEDERNVS